MLKLTKYNIMTLITIIIFSIVFFMIYYINTASSTIVQSKKTMLLNEAKSHFNNMVMLRLWNSSHGGVYLKKHDGLEPNPYLPDNTMLSDKGEVLVRVNPAWMTRQVSEITNERSNYFYKITSLNPINPHNKPDSFEIEGLEYFEKNKNEDYYYKFSQDLKKFDFIGKLNVEPECMQCHGEQNYKVGDVRGGIRVSIPTNNVALSIEEISDDKLYFSLFICFIALIAWVVLMYLVTKIFAQQNELRKINLSLENRVKQEVEKNIQKEIQLNSQSKLVAMGEMIGNIAHQWRQPLSIISTGATGLIMQKSYGVMTDSTFQETLESINDNAQYLSQTIDDFKNFIKGDKEPVEFDLKNDTDSFVKIVDSSIKNYGINVVIDLEEHIKVKGYPNELIQCFINIFNNSKDIYVENDIPIQDRNIFIKQYITGKNVIIEFKDSAGGIPENIIDKIFDAYFTTKGENKGTGLGLHMTHDIIEGMNGSIKVSNDKYIYEGKEYMGAKFIITLPLEFNIN